MRRNSPQADWFFPIEEAPVLVTVTHKGVARDVRVPHKKALIAADTGDIVGIVGAGYKVFTNQQAMTLCHKFCLEAFPDTTPAEWTFVEAAESALPPRPPHTRTPRRGLATGFQDRCITARFLRRLPSGQPVEIRRGGILHPPLNDPPPTQNSATMIRRTFFHLLAGIPLPGLRWDQGLSQKSAGPAPKPVPIPSSNDTPDPEWLQEWLRLPRLPVVSVDLPQIADPQERDLAALILQRIRSGSPFDFYYFGGSEPGKLRRVLPVLVFTTVLDDLPCGAGDPNPLYLLGWCQSRNAPRTFRLDRMQGCFFRPCSTT